MPRNDVVDDDSAVLSGDFAHRPELGLGAERRVDLGADAVEMSIDARGRRPAADTTGSFHRAGVQALDTDALKGFPQFWIAKGGQERAARLAYDRDGVGREPDRCRFDGRAGVGPGERVLEHASAADELPGDDVRVVEH